MPKVNLRAQPHVVTYSGKELCALVRADLQARGVEVEQGFELDLSISDKYRAYLVERENESSVDDSKPS